MQIFIIIVLSIITCLLIGLTIFLAQNKRKYKDELEQANNNAILYQGMCENLQVSCTHLREKSNQDEKTKQDLMNQNAELIKINEIQNKELDYFKEIEVSSGSLKAQKELLEEQIAARRSELESKQALYESREAALNELNLMYSDQVQRLENAHEQEKLTLNQFNAMQVQQRNLEAELIELLRQTEVTTLELEELKETHKLAIQKIHGEDIEKGSGWRLNLKPQETRMVTLIDELVDNYPELASDLNGIKWKKVWLPKIQELCVREGLDKCSGIYRIGVHENGKEDKIQNYIGQAVNVKERWYQHVKKMLGVDAKGSEKLYEVMESGHIEWCEWELVEKWNGDGDNRLHRDAWLDERERYWIEFYGCKEWGLNKK